MNNVVCFADESITVQDAIKSLQMAIDGHETRTAIYNLAIQALQEKQERENPQALTVEELREMDGKPVWARGIYNRGLDGIYLVGVKNEFLLDNYGDFVNIDDAGIEYIAYRYPPNGER